MIVFILLFLIFISMSIYGWANVFGPFADVCAIGGAVGIGLLFFFSCMPMFDKSVETFDTVSTKLGTEIIVQSPGLPTQIVENIKFIDQPLVIIKDTNVNLYGLGETVTYNVQIK